jgi:hypothetical protein
MRKTHHTAVLKAIGLTRRLVPMTTSGNTSRFSGASTRNPKLINSPLMSYDSVTSNLDRLAKIKNFTMFYNDLDNNKLPQWMFITPNMSEFSVKV